MGSTPPVRGNTKPVSRRGAHVSRHYWTFLMPGIAGFFGEANPADRHSMVERMVACMVHEPVHCSGTLTADGLNVAAGYVAHMGSFADCQPIWNERKDICLLFAGENFADPTDLDALAALGHTFERDTADYLVHLYEERGPDFVPSLNGTFSGLVLDLRDQKAVLFTDRYGLGRIYCHANSSGFYFASEAKSILRVLPHLRRLDPRSFGEYFACGCVLQNRTLFHEISLLPGGEAWTFRPGQPLQKAHYFDCQSWESQIRLSEAEYYSRLKEIFGRILPRYFQSRQKISMSLTGGLDSRMIMAWANSQPVSLPCYSHRGMIQECADSRIARHVATICGQPHSVIMLDEDFLGQFLPLAERAVYLTDGCMDVSGATGLYVNRIARDQIAPVRMTGNYGGEVLRGLVAMGPAKLRNPFFSRDLDSQIHEGVATLNSERQCSLHTFILFKQVPWHHYSRFHLESSQLTIRSPYLDNELTALAYQSPAELSVNLRLAARLIGDGNSALAKLPTDRGPLGRDGLLGRLSEHYQEFTFKADYAYDYGMPHWLVKTDRLFGPIHLERLFLGRHKYYHFRYWYRTHLARCVKDVLLDPQSLSRPYLDRQRVEKIVRDHTTGRGNYTDEIHMLLTTELMQRQLIETR